MKNYRKISCLKFGRGEGQGLISNLDSFITGITSGIKWIILSFKKNAKNLARLAHSQKNYHFVNYTFYEVSAIISN